jgi:hypothetical protein
LIFLPNNNSSNKLDDDGDGGGIIGIGFGLLTTVDID